MIYKYIDPRLQCKSSIVYKCVWIKKKELKQTHWGGDEDKPGRANSVTPTGNVPAVDDNCPAQHDCPSYSMINESNPSIHTANF